MICNACGQETRCGAMAPNGMRCDQENGHPLPHRYYTGGEQSYRWGAVEVGCFDPECNREPGHPMPHRDGRGKSWAPDVEPSSTAPGGDEGV